MLWATASQLRDPPLRWVARVQRDLAKLHERIVHLSRSVAAIHRRAASACNPILSLEDRVPRRTCGGNSSGSSIRNQRILQECMRLRWSSESTHCARQSSEKAGKRKQIGGGLKKRGSPAKVGSPAQPPLRYGRAHCCAVFNR